MKKTKKDKKNKGSWINVAKLVLNVLLWILGSILALILLVFIYINWPVSKSQAKVPFGVTFSSRYAGDIGLDWRQAYLAMLDDLNIKYIRVPVYWDLIEKTPGQYDFSDLDWQLEQARLRNAHVILVMGQKVPRWPECFVPDWVGSDAANRKEKLLVFEKVAIERYRDNHPEISNWQLENEPFLDFGICGTIDPAQLDSEIAQAKALDPTRKIVVTDSGELSLWLKAASRADVFGTTMYREVYSSRKIFGHTLGLWYYPIGPNFFKLKQLVIKLFASQNNAIVIELQGEPWVQGWTTSAPVQAQLESMNAQKLQDNVEFAKETGMKQIYVWGVEWWYWMKINQNNPSLWEAAKSLAKQSQ